MPAAPPAAPLGQASPVVIRRCSAYERSELRRQLEAAIAPLEQERPLFRSGEKILLKPNWLMAKPAESAVVTHPEFILAAIELLLDRGLTLSLGDSPGYGSAEKAAAACGLAGPLARYPVKLLNLDQPIRFPNKKEASLFRHFELSGALLEHDGVVNLPKLRPMARWSSPPA
jgi:uncharacterized protein (DUF362 family)